MDAVTYVKEKSRMCSSNIVCITCPACNKKCGSNEAVTTKEAEEIVNIVEKWSKEHPIVTNRQMMKEVFGIDVRHAQNVQLNEVWLNKEYKEPEK